jgi:hypothetical protein
MRSTWVSEAEALACIAQAVGDAGQARREYLEAARDGKFPVRGRREVFSTVREPIPREDWQRAQWLEFPDPLSTGFHFLGHGGPYWYDREVRWADIEALWPASAAAAKPARAPQSSRRGPPPGATNRVHREREALIPALQAARQPGEALRKTIERLEEEEQIKLPGVGSRDQRIDALARVWGRAIK